MVNPVSLIGLVVLDSRDLIQDLTLGDLELIRESIIGPQVLDHILNLDLVLDPGAELVQDIDAIHVLVLIVDPDDLFTMIETLF